MIMSGSKAWMRGLIRRPNRAPIPRRVDSRYQRCRHIAEKKNSYIHGTRWTWVT